MKTPKMIDSKVLGIPAIGLPSSVGGVCSSVYPAADVTIPILEDQNPQVQARRNCDRQYEQMVDTCGLFVAGTAVAVGASYLFQNNPNAAIGPGSVGLTGCSYRVYQWAKCKLGY